jgi:uncharacterized protein YbjT (DUF2867 family)
LAAELGNVNILVAGSTGLIGRLLLKQLMGHDLTLVGRRANSAAPANVRQFTGDAADWPSLMTGIRCNVAICTIGTTIRVAGSKDAFTAVDRDAVIDFATAAYLGGARQFMMVSSVGANPTASNFYLATKGQAEEGAKAIGFDRIDIFRPGLLRGERGGEARPVERLMIGFSPFVNLLTPSFFDHYRAIDASDVASAMARVVGKTDGGVFVHHNREMWAA